MKELLDLGLPLVEKGRNRFEAKGDQIGNYKDLLSTVIALNSSHLDADLDRKRRLSGQLLCVISVSDLIRTKS